MGSYVSTLALTGNIALHDVSIFVIIMLSTLGFPSTTFCREAAKAEGGENEW